MHEEGIERSPAMGSRNDGSCPNIASEEIALTYDRHTPETFPVESDVEPLAFDVLSRRKGSAQAHAIRHVAEGLLENEPDARLHPTGSSLAEHGHGAKER